MIGKIKGGDKLVLTASGYGVPKGTVLYANAYIPVSDDGSIYAAERPGEEYYSARTQNFEASDLEPYKEPTMFRVGDKVRAISAEYGWGYIEKGAEGVVVSVVSDSKYYVDFEGQTSWSAAPADLELVEGIKETKGEGKVEEVNRPEFIIIVKNTEVFKKGGVFRYDGDTAYVERVESRHVRQYAGYNNISVEQAEILLQKKVAVEAVKFNPEFVTLEQNEALVKALEQVNKPKAAKKAPAKKTTVKKASK